MRNTLVVSIFENVIRGHAEREREREIQRGEDKEKDRVCLK
jgi:hypothetical protein